MIEIWKVGNTGVRNPLRIHDAFRLYAESNLVGKIRGIEGSVAFTNYLCAKGILNNAPGKDPTGSYGRKWRLEFEANGFVYGKAEKGCGFSQSDIGSLDSITPFGKAFLKADTIPAVQECFLRALSMHMDALDGKRTFSPLRWTLAVLLELEKSTGSSAVSFVEFASCIQTSTPLSEIGEVVSEILSIRKERATTSSKKKFDAALFERKGMNYAKKSGNFGEYGDMNLRYLRATGIVHSNGRGIAIVNEKHELAEMLATKQISDESPLTRLKKLYEGPAIPTDELSTARSVLEGLERKLHEREISFTINHAQLTTTVDVNNARHKLEALLANDDEIQFAKEQKTRWTEIADYMDLVIKRGGSKLYDDDTEIKVPKDEVSAYLEWIVWRAFLAMNTLTNKPYEIRRFKVDQDFFPVGTAPGNGPDMIAEYDKCKVVIEVTMSDSSRQEAMEGEPVRRHVFDATLQGGKPVYGLFVANNVNTNTAETFRVGTWYSKDDVRTRLDIVPISLRQFKEYFVSVFKGRCHENGEIVGLIQECIGKRDVAGAPEWKLSIASQIAHSIRVKVTPVVHHDIAKGLQFREYLPFYTLRAACGYFGGGEEVEPEGWVKVENCGRLDEKMFVVRASGRSMEPKIHDGDLCVMRKYEGGSRNGKDVLAQHWEVSDPETGGSYSIKRYSSEKVVGAESWQHMKITLSPLNREFQPIEIDEEENDSFRIVAELVKVL